MNKIKLFAAGLALVMIVGTAHITAQSKGTIAPDQIPGIAVYVPYPVAITLDGKIGDWKGIPVLARRERPSERTGSQAKPVRRLRGRRRPKESLCLHAFR